MESRKMVLRNLFERKQWRHGYREQTVGKEKVGPTERGALKYVYYHMQNRQLVETCCMMQGAHTQGSGATQRVGWGGRWEGGSGAGGAYVCLWLIPVDVWQKSTQYCKAIILQLKISIFFLSFLEIIQYKESFCRKIRGQITDKRRTQLLNSSSSTTLSHSPSLFLFVFFSPS